MPVSFSPSTFSVNVFSIAPLGVSIDAFQTYWRNVHGPLAALIPTVRRYVQSHTRRAAYESGRFGSLEAVARN